MRHAWCALLLVTAGCAGRIVSYGELNRPVLIDLLRETVKVRGLEPEEPIIFRVVWVETYSAERVLAEESWGDDNQTLLLRHLGIIRGADSLKTARKNLFTSGGVFGFYAGRGKGITVVDSGIRSDVLEVVAAVRGRPPFAEGMVHEIAHALQDQHFGIDRRLDELVTSDATFAYSALVEGDATLTAAFYDDLLAPSTKAGLFELLLSTSGPRTAEAFHREMAHFVYAEGVRFASALHRDGGFAAIDRAFADPPLTSLEILHPDLFLEGVEPMKVTMSAPRGEGVVQVVLEDILGALVLGMFLYDLTDADTARELVRAWRGDRALLLQNAGGSSAVWGVGFADNDSARRFATLAAWRCPEPRVDDRTVSLTCVVGAQ